MKWSTTELRNLRLVDLRSEADVRDLRLFYVLHESLAGGDEEYHYLGLVGGEEVTKALSSNPEYDDVEFNEFVLQIKNTT